MQALEGDTILTAVLSNRPTLRPSDAGPEPRAGFCLMGACQDCWVWEKEGPRLRACSTLIKAGVELQSKPSDIWPEEKT